MTLAFRPLNPEVPTEWRLVVDAWVRSFQYSDTAGMIAVEDWFPVMIPQVERVLRLPDVRTLVAYETDEPSEFADVHGFITFDPTVTVPVVFYVYVKEGYRRAGYARALFGAAGVDPDRPFYYACTTEIVSRIKRVGERRLQFARHDPSLARFRKDDPRRPRRNR